MYYPEMSPAVAVWVSGGTGIILFYMFKPYGELPISDLFVLVSSLIFMSIALLAWFAWTLENPAWPWSPPPEDRTR